MPSTNNQNSGGAAGGGNAPGGGGGNPPKATPEKKTEGLSPREWAKQLQTDPAQYAAAAHLHGWNKHEHHFQSEPLQLSQEDFKAALDAAGSYPCKPPHAAALSKTVQDKFKDFRAAELNQTKKEAKPKRGSPRPEPEKAKQAGEES